MHLLAEQDFSRLSFACVDRSQKKPLARVSFFYLVCVQIFSSVALLVRIIQLPQCLQIAIGPE
jgi:hypothetical protein